MGFEADLIRALQQSSNGFKDVVFLGITQLGTELLFLAVAVVLYWCIDKRYAYRFFNVYILGVAVNNFIKLGFARTRPFNAYSDIRSIGDPETTYSFPSGHTESIASVSTQLSLEYGKKRRWIILVCAAATLLVMISRMYLGQHYLSDVFTGLVLGIFCSVLFNLLLLHFGDREEMFAVPGVAIAAIIFIVLIVMGTLNGPSGADTLKGLGAFVAFDIGYLLEKRYVRFDVTRNRTPLSVTLRLVIGLGVAVGIQQGFKLFLPSDIAMLYCFLRYFLMAAWVAVAAPLLFKWLDKKIYGASPIAETPKQMEKLGIELAKSLRGGEIILLSGELGAGKTVLCKGIAKGLGVTAPVTSPTFTLMNEYFGRLKFCHFDAYRLDGADEAYAAGLGDYIGSADCVCAIEWWQNIEELVSERRVIKIDIKKLKNNYREVKVEYVG